MGIKSNSGGTLEPNSSERLDGWKEIAAYLRRDVRTVQRWEKSEDLPVRRHAHNARATMYAYPQDLDAWWNNRKERLEEIDKPGLGLFTRRITRIAIITAAVVVLGALVWWSQNYPVEIPRSLGFQERDWILIAHFKNHTGEPLFDETLESALERELSNSRYVKVVPRPRVDEVLRRMKKPLSTPLDVDLAREVCLRDGAIRAFLTGTVEKLGSTYVMSASLAAPSDGRILASQTEEVHELEQVWPKIRDLSRWTRLTLGETIGLIEQSEAELDKVTTPSLKALQSFSKGSVLLDRREAESAAELFQQALREDPEFASAHMWLAFALRNQGLPQADWLPYVEKAVELSEKTTEVERLSILGKSHAIRLDAEKALPYLEGLLEVDPDHYWGNLNLLWCYRKLGRFEEWTRLTARRADREPNNAALNSNAGWRLARLGDPAAAKPYLLRWRELEPAVAGEAENVENVITVCWTELFSAYDYWQEGSREKALNEMDAVVRRLGPLQGEARGELTFFALPLYLALGKWQAAKALIDRLSGTNHRAVVALLTLFKNESGLTDQLIEGWDKTEVVKSTSRGRDPARITWLGTAMARAGHLSEAESVLSGIEEKGHSPLSYEFYQVYSTTLEGEIALAKGELTKAIGLLKESLGLYETLPLQWGRHPFFLGSESLARALERQGDGEGALWVLERASGPKWSSLYPEGPCMWVRNQWLLASLCRKLGQKKRARKIETELLSLMDHANADHPILLQLKEGRDRS